MNTIQFQSDKNFPKTEYEGEIEFQNNLFSTDHKDQKEQNPTKKLQITENDSLYHNMQKYKFKEPSNDQHFQKDIQSTHLNYQQNLETRPCMTHKNTSQTRHPIQKISELKLHPYLDYLEKNQQFDPELRINEENEFYNFSEDIECPENGKIINDNRKQQIDFNDEVQFDQPNMMGYYFQEDDNLEQEKNENLITNEKSEQYLIQEEYFHKDINIDSISDNNNMNGYILKYEQFLKQEPEQEPKNRYTSYGEDIFFSQENNNEKCYNYRWLTEGKYVKEEEEEEEQQGSSPFKLEDKGPKIKLNQLDNTDCQPIIKKKSNNRRRRRGVQLPRRLIKNTKFNNLWGFPRVKEKKIGQILFFLTYFDLYESKELTENMLKNEITEKNLPFSFEQTIKIFYEYDQDEIYSYIKQQLSYIKGEIKDENQRLKNTKVYRDHICNVLGVQLKSMLDAITIIKKGFITGFFKNFVGEQLLSTDIGQLRQYIQKQDQFGKKEIEKITRKMKLSKVLELINFNP